MCRMLSHTGSARATNDGGFDEACDVTETCRRLGGISRSSLYRNLDMLRARGLQDGYIGKRRVFSARSIERVVNAPMMAGRVAD